MRGRCKRECRFTRHFSTPTHTLSPTSPQPPHLPHTLFQTSPIFPHISDTSLHFPNTSTHFLISPHIFPLLSYSLHTWPISLNYHKFPNFPTIHALPNSLYSPILPEFFPILPHTYFIINPTPKFLVLLIYCQI